MDVREKFQHLFENDLTKEYPDKIIKGFNINSPLFDRIRSYCKIERIDYREEIENIGFQIHRKGKILEEEVPLLLKEGFPSKEIHNLSSIRMYNSKLDTTIQTLAKSRGMSKSDYIKSLGFEIIKRNKSKYDYSSIKELRDNYNLNLQTHAKVFGVSRQVFEKGRIDKASAEQKSKETKLEKRHRDLVISMIENFTNNLSHESTYINIFKHKSERRFALFVKDKESHIYIFSISNEIEEKIKETKYELLNERDFEDIKKIKGFMGVYNGRGEEIELGREEFSYIDSISQKLSLSPNELLKKLNINQTVILADRRRKTQEEVKAIMETFLIEDGNTVSLPSDNNLAQNLRQRASRSDMSIEEYIKSSGFQYQRRLNEEEASRIALIEEIQEKCLVKGNKIYISSYDKFYNNISVRAYKKGKTLDQFLLELGFSRMRLEELPVNYQPYDWWSDLRNINNDEEYIYEINKNFIFDDEVYIPSTHPFYDKLFYYSLTKKLTVTEQLEQWGYRRTYTKPGNYDVKTIKDEISPMKINLLGEIKKIQAEIEVKKMQIDRVTRCKKIVQNLKKLYHYSCQLCEEGKEQNIVMENGNYYIEVHHIIPIHNAKNAENEEALHFDSYQNLMCLCPYHHKYLHYHKGGGIKLDENKDKLVNSNNIVIDILKDYHLKY